MRKSEILIVRYRRVHIVERSSKEPTRDAQPNVPSKPELIRVPAMERTFRRGERSRPRLPALASLRPTQWIGLITRLLKRLWTFKN